MGLWDNITGYFSASKTYVPASSANTPSNPLEKAVESLNARYTLVDSKVGKTIKFGAQDDFPIVLAQMFNQSPVHSGIVTKKSKMVVGNGITYDINAYKTPAKRAEVEAFIRNCGGSNQGLYAQLIHASFQYEKYGAFALFIKWNEKHNKIIELRSVDVNSVRMQEPNDDGAITHAIVRRSFGPKATSTQHNEPKRVKLFSKFDKASEEQLLYVKNPYSGNPYYGIPNYVSAYHFIGADFEFGKHIKNSAENGFSPKVFATFIGRNMSAEQKREEWTKFKNSFIGSDAETAIASWVKNKDEAPIIQPLDISNLDKTVDTLSRLNDAKILTAHNVTSPTLFGVMVAGKLGGTGNELVSAYQIFRATETLPNRELLMGSVNTVLGTVGYDRIGLGIQEEQINLETLKGANTEDISNDE